MLTTILEEIIERENVHVKDVPAEWEAPMVS